MAARPYKLAALILLTAAPATAQQFKREVDRMIGFFVQTAAENKSLGDGTCRTTAMVLCAMGNCHRLYSLADGPMFRNPLKFLITCRLADGSFANAKDEDPIETTLWVIDALSVLAPDAYEAEIAAGKKWLASNSKRKSAFASIATDEAKLTAAASSIARGAIMSDGKPDAAASAAALLTLVRSQYLARTASAKPVVAWSETQQKGIEFLMTSQDAGKFFMMNPVGRTGKFMKHYDLGITGMGIASLSTKPAALRNPKEQKAIDAGIAWLVKSQNKEGPTRGSFGQEMLNYTTCAAVMALSKNRSDELEPVLLAAQRFIVALQNVDGRDYDPSDRDYGSIGYGGDVRGDLSNSQFGVDAATKTGLDKSDDFFAKAIEFLQRTQNLPGKYKGKTRDAKTGNSVDVISGSDGGAAYYPGNSPAGYIELPDGTRIPRSYGSMTYALLKTYTLCGVEKDDPRIRAAVGWIEKNFTLDINPGADPKLGEKARFQGLYYYYMVMAQALKVAGIDHLSVPVKGGPKANATRKVDWRKELAAKLASMQNPNGGWLNRANGRWWEESDLVCTTYAMLALEHCK